MKNYEKYADAIKKLKSNIGIEWCEVFAKPKVLKSFGRTCEEVSCGLCNTLTTLWLLKDYEEPEIDWSKVEVDTPILVRDDRATASWFRRYFAKFEDGVVYAWIDGKTSWTTLDDRGVVGWEYAKLAESEEK